MLKFKIVSQKGDNFVPKYQTTSSGCFDFVSAENVTIKPKEIIAVGTSCYFDVDYNEALMEQIKDKSCVPVLKLYIRSSFAFKHGILLANGVGIIDFDYPYEIKALLYNTSKKPFKINEGDRMCQGLFDYSWKSPLIPTLEQTRTGGFGSTGEKA